MSFKQVSDFLSGRSPLMLAIHMGENTVFVQLQLSVLQSQSQSQLLSQSRSQSQLPSQSQSCPSLSSVTPAAASVLSRMGLSPSTTIAEATRSLSQRLQRLHGTSAGSSLQVSGPQCGLLSLVCLERKVTASLNLGSTTVVEWVKSTSSVLH